MGAPMREPDAEDVLPPHKRTNDWGVAVAIAVSIVICLATFVWIFVEIEPFMSDFIGSNVVATPELVDPQASPVNGTPEPDASQVP